MWHALLLSAWITAPSLTTRRGEVFRWKNDELFHNGQSLGPVHIAPEDFEVVSNLRRLTKSSPPSDKSFTICFAPPQLRAPDAPVVERVKVQTPLLNAKMQTHGFTNLAWAQAIITHERWLTKGKRSIDRVDRTSG